MINVSVTYCLKSSFKVRSPSFFLFLLLYETHLIEPLWESLHKELYHAQLPRGDSSLLLSLLEKAHEGRTRKALKIELQSEPGGRFFNNAIIDHLYSVYHLKVLGTELACPFDFFAVERIHEPGRLIAHWTQKVENIRT